MGDHSASGPSERGTPSVWETTEVLDPVKGIHLLYGRPQRFWIGRVGMQASEPTLAPSGDGGSCVLEI